MKTGKNYYNNCNFFKNIKSNYILKQIFENISQKTLMKLINHNKNIQNQLEIGINDFIKYYEQIEIEIIPINKDNKNKFINIPKEDKLYYHIYFNDDKNETDKYYFNKYDNIKKIKIKIDGEIKSFKGLFENCTCIEKIAFLKI